MVIICIFLMAHDAEYLHVFIFHFYVLFGKVPILIFDHFKIRLYVFLLLNFESLLYVLCANIFFFAKYMIETYFLPLCCLFFFKLFLNSVFYKAEDFNFDKVLLISFFILSNVLGVASKNSLIDPGYTDFPCFLLKVLCFTLSCGPL